jgi:undecaprenyl-diphosphatase
MNPDFHNVKYDGALPFRLPSLKRSHQLVLGVTSLVLFGVVSSLVLGNLTQAFDARLALLMNADQGAAVTDLMVLASLYGREYFWIPIVVVMLLFGKRDTKLLAIELAALFIVGIAVGELLKYVAYRPRPFEAVSGIVLRMANDTDSSFPSGHALIVSIGAVFALLKFKNRVASMLLTVEAAVVCYSRVYVGLHYPLDVVAGVLLGVAIVSLGLLVLESERGRSSKGLASLKNILGASRLPEVL